MSETSKLWVYEQFIAGDGFSGIGSRALQPSALVCWCAPLPCHADVLVKALEEE